MKALRFGKFGPPSILAIEEVARPEPRGRGGAGSSEGGCD
jgi:hypothetical protein